MKLLKDPTVAPTEAEIAGWVALNATLVERGAMSLAMLDGFFMAALCSPRNRSPMELLGTVLMVAPGEAPQFKDGAQAEAYVNVYLKLWNHAASELAPWRGGTRHSRLPAVAIPKGKAARRASRDWARGFMLFVASEPDVWGHMAVEGQLWPIVALENNVSDASCDFAFEPDDPASFFLSVKQSNELIAEVPSTLVAVLHYFAEREQAAQAEAPASHASKGQPHSFSSARAPSGPASFVNPYAAPPPPATAGPRIGRNEPCPCGSGKKYKHCCGAV